jgi:hypothetical protein
MYTISQQIAIYVTFCTTMALVIVGLEILVQKIQRSRQ